MKHKHYDLIVAWAGGQKIEYQTSSGGWVEIKDISWDEGNNYRIKPEPKIEVKYFRKLTYGGTALIGYTEFTPDLYQWDLKITYQDGEPINFETPEKG